MSGQLCTLGFSCVHEVVDRIGYTELQVLNGQDSTFNGMRHEFRTQHLGKLLKVGHGCGGPWSPGAVKGEDRRIAES